MEAAISSTIMATIFDKGPEKYLKILKFIIQHSKRIHQILLPRFYLLKIAIKREILNKEGIKSYKLNSTDMYT